MNQEDALYQQIYQRLLSSIEAGEYSDGRRLPTEKELARQYYVSRITVQKAMRTLAEKGKVVRIPGRGSFAAGTLPAKQSIEMKPHRRVGLVMGGYSATFGLKVLDGALSMAEDSMIDLIVKDTCNDQAKEEKMVRSLLNGACDGIIIQPVNGELYSDTVLRAVLSGFPIVMLDRNMAGINAPFVGVNNEKLAYQVVEKLIALHHEKIALLVTRNSHSSTLKERINGYMQAHIDHHMPVNPEYMLLNLRNQAADENGEVNMERLIELVRCFLQAHPEVTAIFGTEYIVSHAAHAALKQMHMEKKVAIVSFDCDSATGEDAQLAHVLQPQYEMGECAVNIMAQLLNKKKLEKRTWILDGKWQDGPSLFEKQDEGELGMIG